MLYDRIPKKYAEKDLKVPFSFRANEEGLSIVLEPKEHKLNPTTNRDEYVVGTGCMIKFQGYLYTVYNTGLLKVLMASKRYASGKIFPNPEDPTGAWRQLDVVKYVNRPVYQAQGSVHPSFEGIMGSLKKMEAPDGDVESLVVEF